MSTSRITLGSTRTRAMLTLVSKSQMRSEKCVWPIYQLSGSPVPGLFVGTAQNTVSASFILQTHFSASVFGSISVRALLLRFLANIFVWPFSMYEYSTRLLEVLGIAISPFNGPSIFAKAPPEVFTAYA